MIRSFEVKNFKSIETCQIELGSVNVFIGANGSGKSNFLEALGVLSAAAFGKVDEESLARRGCRPEAIFQPMFEGCSENSEAALKASSDGNLTYSIALACPPRAGWAFKQELLEQDGKSVVERGISEPIKGDPQVGLAALRLAELEVNSPIAQFLKDLSNFSIYSADTLFLRGAMQDPQFREPVGLSGGGLAEAIEGLERVPEDYEKLNTELRDAISWLEIFAAISNPRKKDPPSPLSRALLLFGDRYFRKDHRGAKHILTANQVNEGTLYFLFVAVLCLHRFSPKCFAIENVDHGLNPLLAKHLISTVCKWITQNERRQQVLLTTHNPLVLDGLPLTDDRIRLFTVDRDNRGTTQIKRFVITDEIRKIASQKGWTLSRMWVNKLIGGVPDV